MVKSLSAEIWTTAYVNDLPDSSFAYIENGGSKDSSEKTEPRSLRHLPYKDNSGKINLPHLRNALARISQVKGMSEVIRTRTKLKLEHYLNSSHEASSQTIPKKDINLEASSLVGIANVKIIEASGKKKAILT